MRCENQKWQGFLKVSTYIAYIMKSLYIVCMDRALIIFQALAEPTRLRILRLLREMELSVGELAQVLGQSQPRVSRHVKVLAEAELVERRKEGSWVFLALGDENDLEPIFAALDHWRRYHEEDDDEMGRADRQRLQAVRNVRMGEAEDWFEVHAAAWDAIRSACFGAVCRIGHHKTGGRWAAWACCGYRDRNRAYARASGPAV